MIETVFFLYIAVASFIALTDWRKGMLLMILVGVLQDPVRKVMTGTPGWIPQDLNNDGVINIGDVVVLGLHWGETW